jgi:ATP-dependent exoDNAse (exonuclease V) alpha subunit
MTKKGLQNYSQYVTDWLDSGAYNIDCDEKKQVIIHMFENSYVALINGAAGTGKSTLINHISHLFFAHKKLFLAQTNPAVDNLKSRVMASNCTFLTVSKFLYNSSIDVDNVLLIIDECSTLSNSDMCKILKKSKHTLLVLVGDIYQINSIKFGNWFDVLQKFIPQSCVFTLQKAYRTNDKNLLLLWDKIRKLKTDILEHISLNRYSSTLDQSIFHPLDKDEIILCLNYNGLYGINNINRFLQADNPNTAVTWGINKYKIDDPVLFNYSNRFAPVIYNNMKGKIIGIEILNKNSDNEMIQFDIQLFKPLLSVNALNQDFILLKNELINSSVIRFSANKHYSSDNDVDSNKSIVPFQIAYAVSIHKAQGLEYNSVKIVITNEVDEQITSNIFYTAVTRAKRKLKIYWTPEVERKILSNLKNHDNQTDISLLKNYIQKSTLNIDN